MKLKEKILVFLLLAVVPIFGCAQIYNPLPGLCYSDKTGSYVCLNKPTDIPKYDRNFNCMNNFYNEELWMQCMNPSNDHIWDPYYKTRKELNERIEQEQKLRRTESKIQNIA